MLFTVAVVFHQISVGDTVSAVDLGDAAGRVEDELDFAGAAGGASGFHCELYETQILFLLGMRGVGGDMVLVEMRAA